jgi:hypothetical protein
MAKGSNKAALQRRDSKRRKRELERRRTPTKNLRQSLDSPVDLQVVPMQPHPKKLSTRVLELPGGLLDDEILDCTRKKNIARLAVFAWNMSVSNKPASEVKKSIASLVGSNKHDQSKIEVIVNEMMARKHALYPDDSRIVVDYEVTCDNNSVGLIVAAAIPAPSAPSR